MTAVNRLIECWPSDTSCAMPTEHLVRVGAHEYGPEAGVDRLDYLHYVITARRDIQNMANSSTMENAVWSLINVGHAAGRLKNLAVDEQQLRDFATLLGEYFVRKIYYLGRRQKCHDVD